MKLKISFRIVLVLCIIFAFASLLALYRISSLEDKNRELERKIESITLVTKKQQKVCVQEQTVIYDVESLEQHLDRAAEEVISKDS